MIVELASLESFSLILLLVCSALAFLSGMVRPNEFGGLPAAMWVSLLVVALLCSGTIGFIESSSR